MSKYCKCDLCLNNQKVINPYKTFYRYYLRKDINLQFDYRASALCRYGCHRFGNKPTCPPNIPDLLYYNKVLNEYNNLYIIGRRYPYSDGLFSSHWREYSTNEIHDLLLQKEMQLFRGGCIYAKAFIGGSCKLCNSTACNPKKCIRPNKARVPLEATGVNVFLLMKSLGLEYEEPPISYFWRLGIVFY